MGKWTATAWAILCVLWLVCAFLWGVRFAHAATGWTPPNGQSYCIGVAPEDCAYSWSQDGGRWTFNPFSQVPPQQPGYSAPAEEDVPQTPEYTPEQENKEN